MLVFKEKSAKLKNNTIIAYSKEQKGNNSNYKAKKLHVLRLKNGECQFGVKEALVCIENREYIWKTIQEWKECRTK